MTDDVSGTFDHASLTVAHAVDVATGLDELVRRIGGIPAGPERIALRGLNDVSMICAEVLKQEIEMAKTRLTAASMPPPSVAPAAVPTFALQPAHQSGLPPPVDGLPQLPPPKPPALHSQSSVGTYLDKQPGRTW